MSVVSSTARMRIGPQNIAELSQHPNAYVKMKKDRRVRIDDAFKRAVLKNPSTNIVYLIYESGACVMLGALSEAAIASAGRWLCSKLKTKMLEHPVVCNVVYVLRHPATVPALKQDNAGVTAKEVKKRKKNERNKNVMATHIRLSSLYERLRDAYVSTSFEPELSPAVIVTPKCAPRAKIMIFRTGSINITGLRSFDAIDEVLKEMYTSILTE